MGRRSRQRAKLAAQHDDAAQAQPDDSGAARSGEAGRRELDDSRAAGSSEAGRRAGGKRQGKPGGEAAASDYRDSEGNTLTLRGSLTPKARQEYAAVLAGGLEREDAWQRAVELLFERLVVSWTIAGLQLDRQKELLARYRVATGPERQFVRDALREHVAENFPELQAP